MQEVQSKAPWKEKIEKVKETLNFMQEYKDANVKYKDANVILGVTGDLQGSVLFAFPKEMALDMVKIMSGMKLDEIDNFVSSALGEIANIIGGNAVTNLASQNYSCDIVPLQVIIGKYKSPSV
ncbi:chemotaxis protein CheX [Peptococcaceae bacterium]|nr:chemotaxis protein CheX [Peptococcaceae bacterium]